MEETSEKKQEVEQSIEEITKQEITNAITRGQ